LERQRGVTADVSCASNDQNDQVCAPFPLSCPEQECWILAEMNVEEGVEPADDEAGRSNRKMGADFRPAPAPGQKE
ncbi:MAG: hypothetical protein ACRD3W_23350, partial [Terriglobales bacterium]